VAYTTLAHVEGRLRGPALTETSVPTINEVQSLINDIAAEENAALASHGLSVPATEPAEFVAWLGHVNATGVCALLGDNRGQLKETAKWFRDQYDKQIASMWDGTAFSSGASLVSGALPTSWTVEYPDEDVDLGTIGEPVFNEAWKM